MTAGRRVVALLLSGGGGTRLWPLSTDSRPKQFLTLFDNLSLYQRTLRRLSATGVHAIMAVGNVAHEHLLTEQATALGLAAPILVLEPMRRDSAAAIAAGVIAGLRHTPADTIFVALPCDHLIPDESQFLHSLTQACELAELGYLVTFGIKPTHAATEYGYIERGDPVPQLPSAFRVAKFHEKPKADIAARYLESGGFDWNSGIFVFRGDTFETQAQQWMPHIWQAAKAAVERAAGDVDRMVLDADAFGSAERTSIDYALFEKSDRVAVVPAAFNWSDVGNWASIHAVAGKDEDGNAVLGDVTMRGATGSLVMGNGMKVIVVGVENLVVVASPQGTFVAPLSLAAEVKALIEQ